MADFYTHVTFSSVLGCGYAFAGMAAGMETSTSLVAGGLCGLSGMLPDVDSSSGIPRRETMGFAAAIVPMLLIDRFRNLEYDVVVLIAAGLYFAIRFGGAKLIGKFSVHRGMWHSIPAALIFAGLAFYMTASDTLQMKFYKAFAVFIGAMSHLVLDEVYSVDTRGVVPKFKKSFGTAVKMWGKNSWANLSTYAKLAVVALLVFSDVSSMLDAGDESTPRLAGMVDEWRNAHGQPSAQPDAQNALPLTNYNSPSQQPQRGFLSNPGAAPSPQQPAAQGYSQPQSRWPATQRAATQWPAAQQPAAQRPAAQWPQTQRPQTQTPQTQWPAGQWSYPAQ